MDQNYLSRSFHLVDPELRELLLAWPIKDISAETLVDVRAMMNDMVAARRAAAPQDASGSGIISETHILPAQEREPDVRAIIHYPESGSSRPRPGYFHIHGGGYVMGSPDLIIEQAHALVKAHDCVVLTPAYRLAPETKFPGALRDCYTALTWFHAHAGKLGVDPDRIVIGGDSAGGGLAASLALFARDQKEVLIAGQFLIYPMLDDRTGLTDETSSFVGEYLWTRIYNQFGWSSLLECEPGSNGVSKYAAAARETDLSGLPPTAILVGALDLFVEENLDYAKRLVCAGVPTALRLYPGAYHAFDMAVGARITQLFVRDCNEALASLLRPCAD